MSNYIIIETPIFILSHLSHLTSKARRRYNDIMGLEWYAQQRRVSLEQHACNSHPWGSCSDKIHVSSQMTSLDNFVHYLIVFVIIAVCQLVEKDSAEGM